MVYFSHSNVCVKCRKPKEPGIFFFVCLSVFFLGGGGGGGGGGLGAG